MLKKRIIPCLDVKAGKVVKGIRFRQHEVVGDVVDLMERYCAEGADELIFYDITASSEARTIDTAWVKKVAQCIDIPFCVAGGIRSLKDAGRILNAGADKISINSPALECPSFIDELVNTFGSQCVVIGIDSFTENETYTVYQYTGSPERTQSTNRKTIDWVCEVQNRGAGEIVLNCMNQDGVRQGYDLMQLTHIQSALTVPCIASGGAGSMQDFVDVFLKTKVTGALAASVFHKDILNISKLKKYLAENNIEVRQ